MQQSDSSSSHPVDQLIARLIRDEELDASPEDIESIVEHIASAPFNRRPAKVLGRQRGLSDGDIILGAVADPLELHLMKRVVEEQQWAVGTRPDDCF